MRKLTQHGKRTFVATDSKSVASAIASFGGQPFVCLIWDHDGAADWEQQRALGKTLLDAGCRYIVCGGRNCSSWHDAADFEFVKMHEGKSSAELDAVHVMTTWHDGEPPDEVAWEFVFLSFVEPDGVPYYLVVHVGTSEDAKKLDAAVLVHAADEATPGRSSRDN